MITIYKNLLYEHQGEERVHINKSWRHQGHPAMEKQNCNINEMPFWQLGTIQDCLSVVMRVWFFTDCVLVTLNIIDDDDI